MAREGYETGNRKKRGNMNMSTDDKYLIDKLTKPRIDWNGPIQLAVVCAILFGANLPFYFIHRHDIKEIEKHHREWQERVMKLEIEKKEGK